jgi:hypothetical protein
MARHEHLPIYKQSYELLQQAVHVSKDFPREFKFTVGQRLRDEILQLLVLIYRANSQIDKAVVIAETLENILVVELLIRLCHDLRILPKKHYASLVLLTESLAKQAEGWKKSASKIK